MQTLPRPVNAASGVYDSCPIKRHRSTKAEIARRRDSLYDIVSGMQPMTVRQDITYDPFLGSGTTLVACEQLGRICYGMEIEPSYVAIILERATEMNMKPRLVRDVV